MSQFVERYHSVVSGAVNTADLISNNMCKFSKYSNKYISNVFYCIFY
jgi:hypothetical protein